MLVTGTAAAHPGRTDASGCHHDRRNGGRHCHGAPAATAPGTRTTPSPRSPAPTDAQDAPPYYRNCDAARAAGVAPLHRGQPGYAAHLDRDNDGIACEPPRRR